MMENGKEGGNLEEERRRIAAKIKAEVIDGKKENAMEKLEESK